MGQIGNQPENDHPQRTFYLTLALVAGQVGCLTLTIVSVALFGGLWLDGKFGSHPIITILLMVGSVPVTLVITLWAVRKTTSRMKLISEQNPKSDQ